MKFVNHRMMLTSNSVEYIVNYVKNNCDERPVIYFSNGKLKNSGAYGTFEDFLIGLGYWSSWSAGIAIWQKDLNKALSDMPSFSSIFPHFVFMMAETNKMRYIIDNSVLMTEIKSDYSNRANYNLFYAFAVEFPMIMLDLVRNKIISISAYNKIKKSILYYVSKLYVDFIVMKKPCSYNLENYQKYIDVFFTIQKVKVCSVRVIIGKFVKRLYRAK